MARLQTKAVRRDGEIIQKAKCPGCGKWEDIDADQKLGTVSLVCEICGWHGYIDGRPA